MCIRDSPFINPENNKTRRDYVLSKMLELGYITQEEYDEAVNTEPEFKSEEYAANAQKIESYFTDYMIDDVIDHLMEKYGYTKEEATNYLYTGGLRIYSTVDTSIQGTLESVYEMCIRDRLKVGAGFALQPDCAPGALLTATASVRGEGTVREYVGPEYPAVSDPEPVSYTHLDVYKRQM